MNTNENIHLPEIHLYRQFLMLPQSIRDYLEETFDAAESYGLERAIERAHEGEWDRGLAITSEERWAKYREILNHVTLLDKMNPKRITAQHRAIVREYARARLLLPRFSHKVGDRYETKMFLDFMRLPPPIRELLARQCDPAEWYFMLRYGEEEVEKVTGSRFSLAQPWRWQEYEELKQSVSRLCLRRQNAAGIDGTGRRRRMAGRQIQQDFERTINYVTDRLQL